MSHNVLRQYIITPSGEAGIGLGNGTIHRLGPGDVHMAQDLTGHGHTTRVVGQVPRSLPRSIWRGEGYNVPRKLDR